MKVLLLTDADAFAGTERHMLDLAVGLKSQGVDAWIGCPSGAPLAERAAGRGIALVAIEKAGVFDWRAVLQLARLLRSGQVDLIHAHNGRTAWLAALAKRIAGRGYLLSTMHFIEPTRSTRSGMKRLVGDLINRFTRSQSSGLIAISDAVRDAAVARGDDQPERVWRVYNGVSQPEPKRRREAVRASLGIAQDTPILFSAVRLEREKSVGVLIDAAALVLRSHPSRDYVWLVAGDGSLRGSLEAQVERLGLAGCVRLLGFRSDVHDLMHASDVLVHPAAAEPFGLVLAEAMALGLPVIASDGGAAPEVVVEGETGWLFEADDAGSLAGCLIEALLSDHASVRGEAGRARYLRDFTADRMARETAGVYSGLLNRARQGSATRAADEVGVLP